MLLMEGYEFVMVVIEKLPIEVRMLTTACRDHENIFHIFDENENEIREEIHILKIQLQEAKGIEDVLTNQ